MSTQRQQRWRTPLAIGGVIFAMGISYHLGTVHADGAPTTTPLYYSGYATDAGEPMTGTHNLRVGLWRDATATDTSMRACETIAPDTPFVAGRFRIPLEASCVAAVRAEANLFVELEIDAARFGDRVAMGAVPYALEADHAVDATTLAGQPSAEYVRRSGGPESLGPGTLHLDYASQRVGVRTTSPSDALHVAGDARVDGTLLVGMQYVSSPSCTSVTGAAPYNDCTCPGGMAVVGGGGYVANAQILRESRPVSTRTWRVACLDGPGGSQVDCSGMTLLCARLGT